ncbi:NFAT activation molecule 1 [Carettochelys insculpta]|uniref:NFAT activation molecule 1 n=1 Tax=Carettochelys insculpta TaxID=44489 RepID=UPI003EBD99B3
MASALNAIFLLLSILQHGGWQVAGEVSVRQDSLIRVAFANEVINVKCQVSFPYRTDYTTFSINYYWVNSESKKTTIGSYTVSEAIPAEKENQTIEKTYEYKIRRSVATGTYYCQAKWTSVTRTGNGVFILVRDRGYTEPTPSTWNFLLALTTILAILSIIETVLLLWKRKVVFPGSSCLQKFPDLSTGAQVPAESSEPSGSFYACLESHQAEVYSVLENDTKSLSREKNPPAKLQDTTNAQPDMAGNTNEDFGKTGKRKKKKKMKSQQETPEESCGTLYENI